MLASGAVAAPAPTRRDAESGRGAPPRGVTPSRGILFPQRTCGQTGGVDGAGEGSVARLSPSPEALDDNAPLPTVKKWMQGMDGWMDGVGRRMKR